MSNTTIYLNYYFEMHDDLIILIFRLILRGEPINETQSVLI